jgi:hypothetical protein
MTPAARTGRVVELQTRPNTHFLYSGKALMITDRSGWASKGEEGYYFENTRFLSRDELEVTGEPLKPTGVSRVGHDALLGHYLASREGPKHSRPLYVTVERFVGEGLATTLRVSNYALDMAYRVDLVLRLDADFADFEEAQQGRRQQDAETVRTWDPEGRELRIRYRHPELDRAVTIRVERAPHGVRWEEGALRFLVQLNPHTSEEARVTVEPVLNGLRHEAHRRSFGRNIAPLERVRNGLLSEAPRLTTSNATVSQAWRTALEDLASLPLGLTEGAAAPIAGLPLYHDFFGRDSLTVGWQALMAMPAVMRDTLTLNATVQLAPGLVGKRDSPAGAGTARDASGCPAAGPAAGSAPSGVAAGSEARRGKGRPLGGGCRGVAQWPRQHSLPDRQAGGAPDHCSPASGKGAGLAGTIRLRG